MRIIVFIITLFVFGSCKNTAEKTTSDTTDFIVADTLTTPIVADFEKECEPKLTLVFDDDNIKSLTSDEIYGSGIILFDLLPGNKLSILNDDDSVYGELFAKEDLTFESTLPKQVIARKLIATSDFATYTFDGDKIMADKDFVTIYINKTRKKVNKAQIKFDYKTWEDYLLTQTLHLKNCNLLRDVYKSPIPRSSDLNFNVLEVKGDSIRIRSSKDCLEDGVPFQNLAGWLRWKSRNKLLVDFTICN